MTGDRGARTELEAVLDARHRAVSDAGRWLAVNPAFPEPLAGVSRVFETTARLLLEAIETDSPELTRSLTALVQAKDSAVRAKILDEEVADASA